MVQNLLYLPVVDGASRIACWPVADRLPLLSNPYGLLTNRGYVTTYENQMMSDIHVKQKLDFVTEGLSARVLYSFDAQNTNRLNRSKIPYTYYAQTRDENGELVYERTDGGS